MAEILGVVNDAPVAIDVPPVAVAYQLAIEVVQVAPNVTVPVPQMAAGVTVGAAAAVSVIFLIAFDSPS